MAPSARRLFLVSSVTSFILAALMGVVVATNPPRECCKHVDAVEKNGDFFAQVPILGFPGHHVAAHYSVRGGVDRVLLVSGTDGLRILAGQGATTVLGEWAPLRSDAALAFGTLDFTIPEFKCTDNSNGNDGGCQSGDLPVVVFLRGDAWKGTAESKLVGHTMNPQGFSGVSGDGPVLFGAAQTAGWVIVLVPVLAWSSIAAACASLALAAWWLISARRKRRAAPAAPLASLGNTTGTEEMLRLMHLAALYVATVERYFFLAGAAIFVLGGVVMFLALPPVLQSLEDTFSNVGDARGLAVYWLVLGLAVPFAMATAYIFWGRQLLEVRGELRKWRRMAGSMEADANAILGLR